MNNISADQLRRAATIKDEIESLEGELSKILGGEVGNGITKRKYTKKAKAGGDVDRFKAAREVKPKRKGMSAAGRAAIAKAAKARWAARKAAGKNSL